MQGWFYLQLKKVPYRHAKAPMRQYDVGHPMERIGLDISGPYPASKRGNTYLMVASCYFTKWMDAIPLKTQKATHVASEIVVRFVSVFGVQLQLHTDLGSTSSLKSFRKFANFLVLRKPELQFENPSLMEWMKGQTFPSKI